MNKSSNKNNNKGNARRVPKENKKKRNRKPQGETITQVSKRVIAPVSQSYVTATGRPRTKMRPNGDITVRHREFFADLLGSQLFTVVRTMAINPGSVNMFPWLSTIATNYESYVFNSLVFTYEATCASITPGNVSLIVDYDPDDPAPTTKVQALAYRGSVNSPSWSSCQHRSDFEDLRKQKTYLVLRGQPPSDSLISYSVGRLNIACQGQQDNFPLGNMWVDYDVTLMTPQLGDVSLGNSLYAYLSGGATVSGAFTNKNGDRTNLGVFVTHTPTNVWQFTFTVPWEGNLLFSVGGTGFAGPNPIDLVTATPGSAFQQDDFIVNTANTEFMELVYLKMIANGVLSFRIAHTTITQTEALFSQGMTPL